MQINNMNPIDECIDNFGKRNCLKYIEEDERVCNFNEKVYEWLNQVKQKEQKYLMDLLSRFEYYDRVKIRDTFKSLYEEYKRIEPEYQDTIYLPVASKGGVVNGATELINLFQRVGNISKKRIAYQIKEFYDNYDINDIKNIVLIDDIIGSGTTTKYFIEHLRDKYPGFIENKKIYIMAIVLLDKGVNVIKSFAVENKLNIEFIRTNYHQKAFSPNYIFPEKNVYIARRAIEKLEKMIAKRGVDVLGYKKSQALLAFYYNTPNNTLSIFWCLNEKCDWKPLIKRYENPEGDELPQKHSVTLEGLKNKDRELIKSLYSMKVLSNKGGLNK